MCLSKLSLVLFVVLVPACAASGEPTPGEASGPPLARPGVTAPPVARPSEPPFDPLAVVERGGELMFSLDDSEATLAKVTRGCQSAPSPPACVSRIRDAGAREGLRITSREGGLWLASFGRHGGREEIFAELGFRARRGPGGTVLCSATTPIEGSRVTASEAWRSFTFEVRDEGTLAMITPRDGTMVYRRAR